MATTDRAELVSDYSQLLLDKAQFTQDEEAVSMLPLLTPSPPAEQAPLLNGINGKSPSPDFIQDEESAFTCPLLSSPPAAVFRHPLETLENHQYERQTTPSSVSTEMTGLSQPVMNESQVQYVELEGGVRENRSASLEEGEVTCFSGTARNSVPSDLLESSSSSSSALQENPSCVQLLGNHHYQHLDQDNSHYITQDTCGIKPGLDNTGPTLPPDCSFLNWNWPIIRRTCFWSAASLATASLVAVIAMIAMVPQRCQPDHRWYQGAVFYEIFPASFQDSDREGTGDLPGLASRIGYLKSIGVDAVRLNSIFPSSRYPEDFDLVTNLTAIEKTLGTMKDFANLLEVVHNNSMKLVLDLPVFPYVKDLGELKVSVNKMSESRRKDVAEKITNVVHNHRSHRSVNDSDVQELERTELAGRKMLLKPYIDGGIAGHMKYTSEHLNSISETLVEEALYFWFDLGVDGVYLKGLENYVEDGKFVPELKKWRRIKESYSERMIMCGFRVVEAAGEPAATVLLNSVDVLDVYLDLSNGTRPIREEIDRIQNSRVYDHRGYPWIHWNIGNVNTRRLASSVSDPLGAILFEFLLPGTISIFYGDEIGLKDSEDPHQDLADIRHLHQLAPMQWKEGGGGFTRPNIQPWLPHAPVTPVDPLRRELLRNMTELRADSPSIYMSCVWKEGESLASYALRVEDELLVVLERSYPRRSSFVALYNAGRESLFRDLSRVYYGGEVLGDLHGRSGEYLQFTDLTMSPGAALIVKLDN